MNAVSVFQLNMKDSFRSANKRKNGGMRGREKEYSCGVGLSRAHSPTFTNLFFFIKEKREKEEKALGSELTALVLSL